MKKISEKVVFEGNWLCVKETVHLNKDGQKVTWETIKRKNVRNIVVVIARLVPSGRYVLIRQFRPAVNKIVIGFPAGLNHDNHTEEHALQELLEETGYRGKITDISPKLALSPAMTDETVQICKAEIDENSPENQNPVQKLEPEEQIEVMLVDSDKTKEFLLNEQKLGNEIGAGLWYLFGINE